MRKFWLFIPLLVIWSCSGKNQFSLTGKINEAEPKSVIYLYEQQVGTSKIIDSAKVKGNGSFHFRVKTNEPRFYTLLLTDAKPITLLMAPGEKAQFETNAPNFSTGYSVSGSPGSLLVKDLSIRHAQVLSRIDSMINEYRKLKAEAGKQSQMASLDSAYVQLTSDYRKEIISFILNHYHSMASIMALYLKYDTTSYVLQFPRDLQFYKIVSDTLSKYYPHSQHVIALKRDFKRMMDEKESLGLMNLMKNARQGMPDIALPDAKGDTIHLTSFTGKVILLSFWNTDCKPCLMANRDYQELYKKYGKSGLVVYQVSIGESRDKWMKNAARSPWISVAEGNPNTSYYMNLYNITQIPTSFLIDRKGNIVARDMSYTELDKNIAAALKK